MRMSPMPLRRPDISLPRESRQITMARARAKNIPIDGKMRIVPARRAPTPAHARKPATGTGERGRPGIIDPTRHRP
jgi:hypothetical protein